MQFAKPMLSWCIFTLLLALSSFALAITEQDKQLHSIFNDYSSYIKHRAPRPDHPEKDKQQGRFMPSGVKDWIHHETKLKSFIERLNEITYDDLTDVDKVNFRMFKFLVSSEINEIKFESYLFPMRGDTGFYLSLIRMGETAEISNAKQAEFYVQKLADIPRYLSEWEAKLALAVKENKVLPATVLVDFEKPLNVLIPEDHNDNPLLIAIDRFKSVMNASEAEKLSAQANAIVEKKVQPAIRNFVSFLKTTYLPNGRKSIAITDMADGEEYYQAQINYYTTLSLTADEVHKIGLEEVKRIRREMEQVIEASGFKGSFAEFIEFLRTDPQFYAKSPEELLKEAAFISKKMDGALPKFFTKLPRQPYGVVPVPEAIAPRYTTGRYSGAPLDSERAGEYWVNTYALDKRPLYVLEALTLHEAVPGHHLQSALTKELDYLPEFRRNSYLSAYGEGWALYCEKLGIEAGFYQTAYSQFGRLSYEMWRAIRLVVDTGMHAKGWTRDQAIKFMEENTALSKHNVRTEIDRYIAWPGQALSYKMGEIKILQLRKAAESALGQRFDIRAFHDEILSHGPVTLPILEKEVNDWIREQK